VPEAIHLPLSNGRRVTREVEQEVFSKPISHPGGDYLMVIQKITVSGKKKSYIRFGYYRKESNEKNWRWGSQTSFETDKRTTETLIRKAMKQGFLEI